MFCVLASVVFSFFEPRRSKHLVFVWHLINVLHSIYMAKNKLMQIALGRTPEEECKQNISAVCDVRISIGKKKKFSSFFFFVFFFSSFFGISIIVMFVIVITFYYFCC